MTTRERFDQWVEWWCSSGPLNIGLPRCKDFSAIEDRRLKGIAETFVSIKNARGESHL